ncbi:MAG TPA: serine hydrolase domain-containing protein [Azospirillaceae bacterium]|nr:serine hydrolase domain-containing protein [Azospirillaceae bacterium]
MALDNPQARLDAIFEAWAKPGCPGAGVAVVQGGRVVAQRTYGLANLEHGVAIGPDTRFHIASISKTFAAAGILALAHKGKLALDDDTSRHIPELRTPAPVSLRHLLSMTSGLRDSGELMRLRGVWYRRPRSMQDSLDLLFNQRNLSFPTGQRFIYTNVNFMLLTRVIERVSGLSFQEFLEAEFLDRLGMADTFVREDDETVADRLADAYIPLPDGGYAKGRWSFGFGGAGSMVSTVPDLVKWVEFLRTTPALFDAMREPARPGDGTPVNYGLGFQTRKWRGLWVCGHGGSLPGYKAYAAVLPEADMGIVLLSNREDAEPDLRVRQIMDALLADRLPEPHPLEAAKQRAHPAATEAVNGLYLDPVSGEPMTLAAKDGRIETDKLGIVHSMTPTPDGDAFADPWPILPARIRLEPRGSGRPRVHLWFGGHTGVFDPVEPYAPSVEDLAACAGTFVSDELDSRLVATVRDEGLHVHFGEPFHAAAGSMVQAVAPDVFWMRITKPGWKSDHAIRFRRGADGRVADAVVSSDRLKDVVFRKVPA